MPTLADRPDAPVYEDVLAGIATERNKTRREAKISLVSKHDYWLHLKLVSSFRTYHCSEEDNLWFGKPWVDHPWVFARARDTQDMIEKRRHGRFINWARYHFKTSLVTTHGPVWAMRRDPSITIAQLTYKVDQTGESMYKAVRKEIEANELLRAIEPSIFGPKSGFKATSDNLTVGRPLGVREPTLSIHSLLNQPTSQHYDWSIVDDPVVLETVRTQNAIESTFQAMREVTALSKDTPFTTWVGTIWRGNDPWMLGIDEGMFERDKRPCFGEDGAPVLRGDNFLSIYRRDMGERVFACQMLCEPTQAQDTDFKEGWLRFYDKAPKDERLGKRVYFVVDPRGGGKSSDSDFCVIWVLGYGEDKNVYALDLVRERATITEMGDLLFQLVRRWKPDAVFVEVYLHAKHNWDYLTERQERDGLRFKMKKLPKIVTIAKKDRIQAVAPMFEQGRILLPAAGFGHGSSHSTADTMDQFLGQEYKVWHYEEAKSGAEHDDCLDALAWPFQVETRSQFAFPERVEPLAPYGIPSSRAQTKKTGFEGVSWAAW